MKKVLLVTLVALTATLATNGIPTPANDYLEPVVLPLVEKDAPAAEKTKKKATTAATKKNQTAANKKKNTKTTPTYVTSQPHDQGGGIEPWVNEILNDPNCIVELFASWKYDDKTDTATWESFRTGFSSSMFTITPSIATGATTALITWDLTGTGYGLVAVTGHQGGSDVKTNLNVVTNGMYVKGMGTIEAPGNGDTWSNMRLLGKRMPVPDSGSTLALLGAALLGLISLRSRKN